MIPIIFGSLDFQLGGDFFPVEGAVVHTRATIKPCSRPLRDIESPVAVQHKLIKSNFKSMRVVRVVLTMFFFFRFFTFLQSRKHVQCIGRSEVAREIGSS